MLVQKHAVNGQEVCYIAPGLLRIENQNIGYTVIADAKAETISFFHDKKKLCFKKRLKDFNYQQVKLIGAIMSEDSAAMRWHKSEDTSLGNQRVSLYKASETRVSFSGSRVGGGYLAGAKRNVLVNLNLYVSKDIVVPKELSRAYAELQGTPDVGGIAIQQID